MRILLATDGLPAAVTAGVLVCAGLRRSHEITSACVVDGPGVRSLGEAEIVVEESKSVLAAAGFSSIQGRVLEGDPPEALARLAADEDANLIVLGAGNHNWYGRLLFGSVSTTLLHSSTRSVLIAHSPPARSDRLKVVVGIDPSREAVHAFTSLLDLLEPSACPVHLVEAVQILVPALKVGPAFGYAASAFSEEIEEEWLAPTRRRLVVHAETARAAGFEVTTEGVLGSAARRLLEAAEQQSADLVAVGGPKRSWIDRKLLGSVGDQIVRHAPAGLVLR